MSHCFPLNGNQNNPYCKGVEGLVNSYMETLSSGTRFTIKSNSHSLTTVSLAEPTCYSQVLRFAAEDAMMSSNEVEYTVILLITDGGVTDFQETKQALVKMSKQPISVVLVRI